MQLSFKVFNLLVLENFFNVLTIYRRDSHVIRTTFRSPDPWRLHIKFGYNWPSGSDEKSFESVNGRRTDDGARLSYKLPGAFGSGEL